MIKRINTACKFFPCHKGLEDCTFCYCPFYPCLDDKWGEYVFSSKGNKNIWSCKKCNRMHKRKNIEPVLALIRKNIHSEKAVNQSTKIKSRNLKSDNVGIIILSHGTKLKKANASLDKIVASIKCKIGWEIIVPAYLQLCLPGLSQSVENLVSGGCRKIIIVPFFLFNGNHVTRDIPCIIEKEKAKYPEIKFVYTNNLGQDLRIIDIVSDIVEEAVESENNY